MIHAHLYKNNFKKRYSSVNIELFPTKIVFHFMSNSFSILGDEFIGYTVYKNKITFTIKNLHNKPPLIVSIIPIKSANTSIIVNHIKKYIEIAQIPEEVTNPLFT